VKSLDFRLSKLKSEAEAGWDLELRAANAAEVVPGSDEDSINRLGIAGNRGFFTSASAPRSTMWYDQWLPADGILSGSV
jgi:hypothetical protein